MQSQTITDQLITIRDYIRYAASLMLKAEVFFGHGTDNAWDEAVQLVLLALNLPANADDRVLDARLTIDERERIFNMIDQRITTRKPLPYITQTAYFGGIPFKVTEAVLIPRSPVAEVIDQGFEPWIQENRITKVLDLCTGSGCIGILMALKYGEASVDLADISSDALAIAKQNVQSYQLQDRVQCIETDLFSNLVDKKYDIIISNPPYVSEASLNNLPKEYAHEPKLALVAGEAGLDVVIKILSQAYHYLSRDGFLIVEVGEARQALCEHFPKVPFTWLDFEQGGEGVFVLEYNDLKRLAHELEKQTA